jgi:hypothetical protein
VIAEETAHRLPRLSVGIVVTLHPGMTGMVIVTEETDGGAT